MARGAVLALVLPAMGCILLVHPHEYGDHCAIANASTDCGKCVTTRCQAELDTCCEGDACTATLGDLEGCAKDRGGACDTFARSGTPLAACVGSRCGGFCANAGGGGPSQTHCDEPFLAKGSACTCTTQSPANGLVCSPRTYAGTICCAPAGWPGPGIECACLPIGCFPNTEGCVCNRVDYAVPETTCAGVHCCAQDDGCFCTTRACNPGQREVTSCSVAEVGCPHGQTRVDSCSVP